MKNMYLNKCLSIIFNLIMYYVIYNIIIHSAIIAEERLFHYICLSFPTSALFSVDLDEDSQALNVYQRKSVIRKTLSVSLGPIQTTGS